MRQPALLLPAVALLALAACDNAPTSAPAEAAGATGEVLEGSLSDDMLPLDQLRSQPPQAEIVPEASGEAGADDAAPEADAEAEAAAEAAPEPAPTEETAAEDQG